MNSSTSSTRGIEITTDAADCVPSGTSNCEDPVNCEIATGTVLGELLASPWDRQIRGAAGPETR